jgi:hypothetical protein
MADIIFLSVAFQSSPKATKDINLTFQLGMIQTIHSLLLEVAQIIHAIIVQWFQTGVISFDFFLKFRQK